MIKMYQKDKHEAGSVEFWEENWHQAEFEEYRRFCDKDPLKPFFEQYAPPGSLMLEGGCGIGHIVDYYSERGVKVIGLDFAQKTLHKLHSHRKQLLLCAGDIAALPFSDDTFDVYYSGGVVEHFESGATQALKECKRVLRSDGVLLIGVPYHNLVRQALSYVKKEEYQVVTKSEADLKSQNGRSFFQYAYHKKEFEKMLAEAGLRVVKTQGYSVLWGISELPFMKFINKSSSNDAATSSSQTLQSTPESKAGSGTNISIKGQAVSLLKKMLLNEDDKIPVLGAFLKVLRWSCANMMMYVCVRDK
ncbi:MAG: class I SAM-dependent methyltransferase [Pyrinomonadaceae bacterium]